MKVVEYYKKDRIFEADDIQNGSGTGVSDEVKQVDQQKISNINKQIAELMNKKLQLKTQYQQAVKNIDDQIVLLQKQLADMGGNVDPKVTAESVSVKFSKALYESLVTTIPDIYTLLRSTFDAADVSYTPSKKRLDRFAKEMHGFIAEPHFKDSDESKKDMIVDYFTNMLKASHVSLSTNENKRVVDKFISLGSENPVSKWMFEE